MKILQVTPSIILKFKTRLIAESALNLGKSFQDRMLQLSWYTQQLPGKEGEVGRVTNHRPVSAKTDQSQTSIC